MSSLKTKTAIFLKTKHIGDSIILTSAISALPNEYKYIDVVCLSESNDIFEMNPRVRNIFVIPRDLHGLKKAKNYMVILRKIISYKYDLLIQFSGDWRGAFLSRLLNVELSVAGKTVRRGYIWHKSFDVIANLPDSKRHRVEQDLDLLRKAGLFNKAEAPPYKIIAPKFNIRKISKWLLENKAPKQKKTIVIHAASRWTFKEIPISTWVELIQSLKINNFNVILSGSNGDLKFNNFIYQACKLKPILTKDFSLFDTSALYKLSDLVVTIDSMSAHLASALQVPVVAIFGPTNEKNWAPWKVKYKVIALSETDNPSLSCRPCGQDGCGGSKVSHCLTLVSSKMILNESLKILRIY